MFLRTTLGLYAGFFYRTKKGAVEEVNKKFTFCEKTTEVLCLELKLDSDIKGNI